MVFKIASYNMRNLFDDVTSDGSSAPKPDSEIKALVRTIDALRADIIGAQEVESALALNTVNQKLRTPYPHVKLVKGNSGRGIHLGFLSRYPFRSTSHRRTVLTYENGRDIQEYADESAARRRRLSPLLFQRDCLLGRFELNDGRRVSVFNVHLKSQRDYNWLKHKAAEIRAAEARAVARIAGAYGGDNRIVVGDFNEKTGEWPIKALSPGLGFHDPLEAEIENRGLDPHTYHPIRYRGRIDYILLSSDAQDGYVPGSIKIHRSQNARKASDHYPISVKLRF